METSSLRIFMAVADTGSISRAAEQLHYVQSNVTARIRKLEEELGSPLFHRQSRGMVMTQAGRVLRGYAERVLRLVAEARDAVAEQAGLARALTIGTMETTAAVRLPPVLAAFHRRFPRVDLTLVPGPSDDLVQEILAWRLDGAFVCGSVDHPDLAEIPVFDEELVLVAAPDATPAARRVLLIFRRGCAYRARAEQWLREQGHVPFRVMDFGSVEGILGCVGAGMGVTLLPRSVVDRPQYCGTLTIEPLPDHIGRAVTVFAHRRDAAPEGALATLLAMARETEPYDQVA